MEKCNFSVIAVHREVIAILKTNPSRFVLKFVTNHNVWRLSRSILITLAGWLLIIAGGYRMFLPTAAQLGPDPFTYGLIALLGAYGLVLTVIAYVKN